MMQVSRHSFFFGVMVGAAMEALFIQLLVGYDAMQCINERRIVKVEPQQEPAEAALGPTSTSPELISGARQKTESLSFTEILIASGSDKYYRHHYECYYTKWFEPYRSKPGIKMLEIGAYQGRSLNLWANYFDNPALVLGLAYGRKFHQDLENSTADLKHVETHYGDQAKKETMDYLIDRGPWDIILDDGSHLPQHMIFSLFSLWNSVKPGGLYIIEDLETNYWKNGSNLYEYQLNNTGIGADAASSAVTKIQQIQQVLVRHQIGARMLTVMPGDHDICSVEWGMNNVVLRKCEEDQRKPHYQKPVFDAKQMKNWIAEARSTNPRTG